MTNNLKEFQGRSLTKEEEFWIEAGKSAVKNAVIKQEDAAKQLISITSILQGIYFAVISFSDLKKAMISQQYQGLELLALVGLFVSPIIIWLFSLGFSVRVLVPITRNTNINSPNDIRIMFMEAIYYKKKFLNYAHSALILGFIPLVASIIVYLVWMQVPNVAK